MPFIYGQHAIIGRRLPNPKVEENYAWNEIDKTVIGN